MNKKHMKYICTAAAVCIVVTALTGAAGDSDASEIEQLLQKRTAVMEKTLSGEISFDEGRAKLSDVEQDGLYHDDIENIIDYTNSDYEKIISMKVCNTEKKSHVSDMMTFQCDIIWTCSGYDGIYSEKGKYNIGAVETEKGMKLVSFKLIK